MLFVCCCEHVVGMVMSKGRKVRGKKRRGEGLRRGVGWGDDMFLVKCAVVRDMKNLIHDV